ncbi:hypothetical protein CHKEEEPN_3839 [Methylorubrum podarium]|nr:hypothetical protein CHKEEEPN_3839 [Methylorubrum podarium]
MLVVPPPAVAQVVEAVYSASPLSEPWPVSSAPSLMPPSKNTLWRGSAVPAGITELKSAGRPALPCGRKVAPVTPAPGVTIQPAWPPTARTRLGWPP